MYMYTYFSIYFDYYLFVTNIFVTSVYTGYWESLSKMIVKGDFKLCVYIFYILALVQMLIIVKTLL